MKHIQAMVDCEGQIHYVKQVSIIAPPLMAGIKQGKANCGFRQTHQRRLAKADEWLPLLKPCAKAAGQVKRLNRMALS